MVKNDDSAGMFEAIADLPAFDDAGAFRIRAHHSGARTLRSYIEEMHDLIGWGGDLTELPAIGDDLAALIAEAVLTGRMRTLDNLRASAPIPSPDLLEVEGTGPKPARAPWQALEISAPDELHRAVLDRRVPTVAGFRKKTEARLAEVFAKAAPARSGRWPIGQVLVQAGSLRSYTATIPLIRRAETAGSVRQGRDRVGDLDTVIETEESRGALGQLLDWSRFKRIAAMGNTRATAILDSGLQVDTRGGLALCPDIAAECELANTAVNDVFHFTRAEQTDRLIRAVTDPRVRILSHPKGRPFSTRGLFVVNMKALASAAASTATALELSAGPLRIDLLDRQARLAAGAGALIAITAEAESPADFGRLDLGVTQARRGWLRPDDNINPKAVSEMVARLRIAPSAAMEKEVAHAG